MNAIKKYRNDLKMSQYELAQKVKVERSTVSKWENGTFPRPNKLRLVASALGCSIDDLLCAEQ